jgi:hypothetical protein
MGKINYTDQTSEKKKQFNQIKSYATTANELGFRLSGIRVIIY